MKKSRMFNKPVEIDNIRQSENGWAMEMKIDGVPYSCEATYDEFVHEINMYNKLARPVCEIHLRIEYKEDCPNTDTLLYAFNREASRYGCCGFGKEEGIKGVFNPHLHMLMWTIDEKITLFRYEKVWNRTGPYPRQEFVGVGPLSSLWLRIRSEYHRKIWDAEHNKTE